MVIRRLTVIIIRIYIVVPNEQNFYAMSISHKYLETKTNFPPYQEFLEHQLKKT